MNTQLSTRTDVQLGSLAAIAQSPDKRQRLICKNLLTGETLKQAQADAAAIYPTMLANQLTVGTYGADTLSGLNDLIERMFDEIKAGKDPEVARIAKDLFKALDTITSKYNAEDPKFLAKYGEVKTGFLSFFGGIEAFWRAFLRDVRSISAQLKEVKANIGDGLRELEETVSRYQVLREQNEAELSEVVYHIAVMELIVDIASADAKSIPVGDAAAGDRGAERRAERADLITNLQNRINGYKSRLIMGFNTSPQLRSNITLNISLYNSMTLSRDVTFPAMLQVMIQIADLRRSHELAQQQDALRDALNRSLQQYAVNASVIVPEITRSVSVPILMAQTLKVIRDSYVTQTEGVITALDEAAKQNDEIEFLFLETAQTMTDQTNKVSDSILDRVDQANRRLEIISTVPATT